MEFMLEEPLPSTSCFPKWVSIASFDCLSAQERVEDESGTSDYLSWIRRAEVPPVDLHRFRVVQSFNSVDFTAASDGRRSTTKKKTLKDDDRPRMVLSVAHDLGSVMESFGLIVSGWRQMQLDVENKRKKAAPGTNTGEAISTSSPLLAPTKRSSLSLTPERWKQLLAYVQQTAAVEAYSKPPSPVPPPTVASAPLCPASSTQSSPPEDALGRAASFSSDIGDLTPGSSEAHVINSSPALDVGTHAECLPLRGWLRRSLSSPLSIRGFGLISTFILFFTVALLPSVVPPEQSLVFAAVMAPTAMMTTFLVLCIARKVSHSKRRRRLSMRRGDVVNRVSQPPLPALTEVERRIVLDLQNYGAPYSSIVLRPLRGWNLKDASGGWQNSWEVNGVTFSERPSPYAASDIEIRAVLNVPHCSVGAMQRVFLGLFYPEEDEDAAATPSAGGRRQSSSSNSTSRSGGEPSSNPAPRSRYVHEFLKTVFPRCSDVTVVKQLDPNIFVVRSVQHQPAIGLPPVEMYCYVSPAILLDQKQQEELGIRHPLLELHARGNEGQPRSSAGYVYMISVVHCPKEVLSGLSGVNIPPTPDDATAEPVVLHHQMWLGFEEPDGSLTVGVYRSLSIDSLRSRSVYQRSIQRTVIYNLTRLGRILSRMGPCDNELTAYRNHSRYCPLLTGSATRREKAPQPPPGILWSSQSIRSRSPIHAMEPLPCRGVADGVGSPTPAPLSATPSSVLKAGITLPTPLALFIELATNPANQWNCVSDQSQNGLKTFITSRNDAAGCRAIKSELYLPFQCLEAVEGVLLSSMVFPSFGLEVSRREIQPLDGDLPVGLVPVETIFKTGDVERVMSPRTMSFELSDGIRFTAAELFAALPAAQRDLIVKLIPSLEPDTYFFFFGGESAEGRAQVSSMNLRVPCYGFLCWNANLATEGRGSGVSSLRGSFVSRPDSTAGGVRIIALTQYRYRRLFHWSFQGNQVQEVNRTTDWIREMCAAYTQNPPPSQSRKSL